MIINVLIENTSGSKLNSEHGLSFLIEYKGKKYLLDAGQTDAFTENAEAMNLSLDDVYTCVLSHGHYDHGDGFLHFLARNEKVSLWLSEYAERPYYSTSGGNLHFIGISPEIGEKFKARFKYVKDVAQVAEGVYLLPHSTKGLEKIGKKMGLYKQEGEKYLPDNFVHEITMVFELEEGLVVLNSCSHAGILNILQEVKCCFPKKEVIAFLGGLHIKDDSISKEEFESLVQGLNVSGLKKLFTGHCTGEKVIQQLSAETNVNVIKFFAGMEIEL